MFMHEVDRWGVIHRFWLEAERSKHNVGGAQTETDAEKQAAASRGKATAVLFGTRAMGTRFNVQMLVQLPVKQTVSVETLAVGSFDDDDYCEEVNDKRGSKPSTRKKIGTSNAARVSRGTEEDVWKGLAKGALERDPTQHATITITMYYTVVGGVPSEADVIAAIEDLNSLYASCPSDKRLVNCTEITAELTAKDMQDITKKLMS